MEKYIQQNLQYSPSYNNGLSNHLSMAILALDKIGANEQQIDKFFNSYSTKLESIINYPQLLDMQRKLYENLKNNYSKIKISEVLDNLIPYLTTGGFHGIIRVAYILEELEHNISIISQNIIIKELAMGITYWEKAKIQIDDELRHINLQEIIKKFHGSNIQQTKFSPNLIYNDLLLISKSELYKEFSGQIQYTAKNDELLHEFALDIYIETRDFTAIHMVTLMHAYEIIKPYINRQNEENIQTLLWNNLLAAAIRAKRSSFDNKFLSAEQCFIKYKDKVLNSNDDHVIKLYYTLSKLYRKSANPKYITALQVLMSKQ
ncbi:MAG: questin oxidase family protein [Burkholderiales bacterium]|nr:questin oxidase family protein [Burkholderiales bacterium]